MSTQPHQPDPIAQLNKFGNPTTATLTEVKTNWKKVVGRAKRKPVCITQNGKSAGILLSPAAYADLIEAWIVAKEDAEDIAAVKASENEPDIPWETVVENLKRDGLL